MLHYSEFSTVVDGVTYTCNISPNHVDEENNLNANNVKVEEKESTDEAKVDNIPNPVKIEPMDEQNDSSSIQSKTKKTSSIAGAAETRSIYKKLLHDIDRLVSKSQEEMTSIAEEDLNEIARSLKSSVNPCAFLEDSPSEKQKKKPTTPVKRNKEKKNGKDGETGE